MNYYISQTNVVRYNRIDQAAEIYHFYQLSIKYSVQIWYGPLVWSCITNVELW